MSIVAGKIYMLFRQFKNNITDITDMWNQATG